MVGYDNLIFGPTLPGYRSQDGVLAGDSRLNVSEKNTADAELQDKEQKFDSGTEKDTLVQTEV